MNHVFRLAAQGLPCLVAGICLLLPVPAVGEEEPPVRIPLADLQDKVAIIGNLGHPLGTILEIVGYWQFGEHQKLGVLTLHVFSINGRKIGPEGLIKFTVVTPASPTYPEVERVAFHKGEVYRLTGFEAGYFYGVPLPPGCDPEVPILLPKNGSFQFINEFRYLSADLVPEAELDSGIRQRLRDKRTGKTSTPKSGN